EMAGVRGVVGAFFLGLGVGAWALDRPIARASRPGLWYVVLEIALAVWACVSLVLIPRVDEIAAGLLGKSPGLITHAGLATLIPALLLLPATAAMGATLPAMERFAVARERERSGSRKLVGGLYSANTLGAMIGALAITFWVLPSLGFRGTTLALAGLNVLCALGAIGLGALKIVAQEDGDTAHSDVSAPSEASLDAESTPLSERRVWATLFATGFLGIAYETVGIRMLSQILENTVYTFAVVLSVYLLGTAAGAALFQRWLRDRPLDSVLGGLLASLSIACFVGTGTMDFGRGLHDRLGYEQGFIAAVFTEGLLATLVFLVPSVLMGVTFGALTQHLRRPDGGLGRALAVNTLGSALAPSLAGWLLVPVLGLRWAMVAIAAGYGALALGRVRSTAFTLSTFFAVVWIGSSELSLIDVDEGAEVLSRRDGVMATVTVTERSGGTRTLRVDNHFRMGSSQRVFLERRLGMIPLLLHPEPERALFLGLGTGVTLSSATFFDGLKADGVELVPEVLDALPLFEL
ncbi:MAG: spermidine synthase, partial [Planctomycetota bacterium]